MRWAVSDIHLLLLCCFASTACAQSASDKFRDVNSTGPYPIYIVMQGTLGCRFDGFGALSKNVAPLTGSGAKTNLWGGEATAGFVINERKLFNVYIEPLSFRYLLRNQGREQVRLLFNQQSASLRVGFRWNIFYPVTLHVIGGLMYYKQVVARIDEQDATQRVSSTRIVMLSSIFGSRFQGRSATLPGVDWKIRLNLLDATGSSGGLGFYLELQGAHYFTIDSFSLARLAPGQFTTEEFRSDSFTVGVSAGLTLPLALRMK